MGKLFKKALKRNLITDEENIRLRLLFEKYFKLINAYIKSIGQTGVKDQLQEPDFIYDSKKSRNPESLLTNDEMTNDQ